MKKVLLILSIFASTAYSQVTTPLSLREGLGVRLFSLQQLKDSARQNNIAMRMAQLDIASAQQQRKEAFTKYFPNVSGTGLWFNADKGMARTDIDPSGFITPELGAALAQTLPMEALAALQTPIGMSMMKNGTLAGITALQPIFAGGQIVNGNRLAKVGEEVSHLQLQLSENEVDKQVEQYYWQLVSLGEKMKTIAMVDSLLASIHKDVDVAVRAGVAMRNDLLQVQLRQNDIESQKLKLQNGISILHLVIAQYCGLSSDNFNISAQPLSAPVGEGLGVGSVSPDSNLTNLAEHQLLEKQVEAMKLQKKMTIGQNLPTLAIGAGYNYHNLLDNDRSFAMAFATVSVPISDWWGGSHAIKRRRLEQQKAEDQLRDGDELLRIRMQKAYNDVIEAQQQLQLAQRSIEQADENLRLHRDYYRAGTATMSNLLEAQLLYQQTLDRRSDAYADLQNKLLEYRQSIGQ